MIRLNKYLQEAGLCSRRTADQWIDAGRVTVDGRKAVLGEKIEVDIPDDHAAGGAAVRVCVDGKEVVWQPAQRIVIALNKPVGIVCTEDDREPDNVIRFLHYPQRVTYAGRLDKASEGLLLLTNDGDLIERMMRGRHAHEKEYEVAVDRDLREEDLEKMRSGVPIEVEVRRTEPGAGNNKRDQIRTYEKVMTRPCIIRRTGPRKFNIILTQGLNRQIRKMCAHCGYQVKSLKRVRIMNIELGDLPVGQWRPVTEAEMSALEELTERDD